MKKNIFEMYAKLANLSPKVKQKNLRIIQTAQLYLKQIIKIGDVLKVLEFQMRDPLTDELLYLIELPNTTSLNLKIISEGYAYPDTKALNKKLKIKFNSVYEKAIKKKKGLWKIWKWKDEYSKNQAKVQLKYLDQKKISLMTYNLENFFDVKIDSPRDITYIPRKLKSNEDHIKKCHKIKFGKKACLEFDWSEIKFDEKMKRIAQVILEADPRGHGPDILLLEELENYSVLKKLITKYLPNKGYKIYHVESRDFRGLDTAVLSKLELAQLPIFHEIKFSKHRKTRGILSTTFFLPNHELLTVFPFHFPSQFSQKIARSEALVFLDRYIEYLQPKHHIIGGGDCNITKKEEAELYSNYLNRWEISHKVGCKSCLGTYYYSSTKSWSFFDVFYYSKSLSWSPQKKSSWVVDPKSIRIINKLSFQNTKQNTPMSFHLKSGLGISDHWPLYMELNYLSKNIIKNE